MMGDFSFLLGGFMALLNEWVAKWLCKTVFVDLICGIYAYHL